jgi:hypothetical protein
MGGFPVVYPGDDWCGDHKIGTNPHKAAYKVVSMVKESVDPGR